MLITSSDFWSFLCFLPSGVCFRSSLQIFFTPDLLFYIYHWVSSSDFAPSFSQITFVINNSCAHTACTPEHINASCSLPNAHCLPVYIYAVFCCAGWRIHKWLLCGHLPVGLPLPSHWSHHRSGQGQEPALSRSERSAHHYGSLEPLQGWNDSVEANIMSLLISFM